MRKSAGPTDLLAVVGRGRVACTRHGVANADPWGRPLLDLREQPVDREESDSEPAAAPTVHLVLSVGLCSRQVKTTENSKRG